MKSLKSYIIVTLAYWCFMLTDGALRMMVLLYFHNQGYTPLQLAFLFLLYEFCGVVTNLWGGWLACRTGLRMTLLGGLLLQVVALLLLSAMDPNWPPANAVVFVMAAQALSGVAKDLTKMSAKTSVKFLAPTDKSSALFRWVAVLTGSKNAVKGTGFFVGAGLLEWFGFQRSLWLMAGGIGTAFVLAISCLPPAVGKVKTKKRAETMFKQVRNINILSTARLFLFAARDIWFVVGVPVYFSVAFGWSFVGIGTFMALWIIGYGVVQAIAPQVLALRTGKRDVDGRVTVELTAALMLCLVAILVGLWLSLSPEAVAVGGLMLFGFIFALNSSVHSFLILEYADHDRAATSVGFYYMANAGGRLIGTLLSGVLYQAGGINACLVGAATFLLVATLVSSNLNGPNAGTEASEPSPA